MKRALSRWLLRLAGWHVGRTEGVEQAKCVICVAPHTSNWDFVIGKLFYTAIGCDAGFLMKRDWFFFPFGVLFRHMGGIPVDRSRRASVTDQIAAMFHQRERLQIAVTPEGTRGPAETWKRGFYYMALKGEVPILLAYIDYKKREAGILGVFHPTGDADADIAAIRRRYRGVTACHPENFVDV